MDFFFFLHFGVCFAFITPKSPPSVDMETSKQAYTWELESWRATRFSSQQAVIPSFHQLLFVFSFCFIFCLSGCLTCHQNRQWLILGPLNHSFCMWMRGNTWRKLLLEKEGIYHGSQRWLFSPSPLSNTPRPSHTPSTHTFLPFFFSALLIESEWLSVRLINCEIIISGGSGSAFSLTESSPHPHVSLFRARTNFPFRRKTPVWQIRSCITYTCDTHPTQAMPEGVKRLSDALIAGERGEAF